MEQDFFTLRLNDAGDALVVLDQTLLPAQEHYISLRTKTELWEAIRALRVRGAPAIGIAAGYGYYLTARELVAQGLRGDALYHALADAKVYLASSRPTAVNLFWALDRMEARAQALHGQDAQALTARLREEAQAIQREDEAMCRAIGGHGITLLRPGMGVLTHCNAGALAASRYGTALSPIYLAQERGYGLRVYADETRPLLQGARLTAWELQRAGVDITVLCDNMAASAMQAGLIDACIVGCDRMAANGDAANKIGTSALAIVAKAYNIPFYVALPSSTIDLACPTGRDIVIEQRAPEEVTSLWYARSMAPAGIHVYNPAFDVTDHTYITGVITERGVMACGEIRNLSL